MRVGRGKLKGTESLQKAEKVRRASEILAGWEIRGIGKSLVTWGWFISYFATEKRCKEGRGGRTKERRDGDPE